MYFLLIEHFFQHQKKHLVIINSDNIIVFLVVAGIIPDYPLWLSFFGGLCGYFHYKTAAPAFFTFQPDSAVEHRHDALYDGKSQPEAVFCDGV